MLGSQMPLSKVADYLNLCVLLKKGHYLSMLTQPMFSVCLSDLPLLLMVNTAARPEGGGPANTSECYHKLIQIWGVTLMTSLNCWVNTFTHSLISHFWIKGPCGFIQTYLWKGWWELWSVQQLPFAVNQVRSLNIWRRIANLCIKV